MEIIQVYFMFNSLLYCDIICSAVQCMLTEQHGTLGQQQLRNLMFALLWCFAAWQVWSLQTCQAAKHPGRSESWK